MRFTLVIETENAAFDESKEFQVARILHYAAKQITEQGSLNLTSLRDVNGNTVGSCWVE